MLFYYCVGISWSTIICIVFRQRNITLRELHTEYMYIIYHLKSHWRNTNCMLAGTDTKQDQCGLYTIAKVVPTMDNCVNWLHVLEGHGAILELERNILSWSQQVQDNKFVGALAENDNIHCMETRGTTSSH